jgi:predicted Zn-dependent protease with MMP-like domain
MDRRRIVMNFSTPPAPDDVHAVAISVVENIPQELAVFCEDMDIVIDEFASRDILDEADLESEFDLLAIYRDEPEKIPGVVSKTESFKRTLIIFRRPVLDLWCDTGEDFVVLIRHVIISEVAQANGFSDEEIEIFCAAANAAAVY